MFAYKSLALSLPLLNLNLIMKSCDLSHEAATSINEQSLHSCPSTRPANTRLKSIRVHHSLCLKINLLLLAAHSLVADSYSGIGQSLHQDKAELILCHMQENLRCSVQKVVVRSQYSFHGLLWAHCLVSIFCLLEMSSLPIISLMRSAQGYRDNNMPSIY